MFYLGIVKELNIKKESLKKYKYYGVFIAVLICIPSIGGYRKILD